MPIFLSKIIILQGNQLERLLDIDVIISIMIFDRNIGIVFQLFFKFFAYKIHVFMYLTAQWGPASLRD